MLVHMHEPHSSEVRRITHFVRVEVVMDYLQEGGLIREGTHLRRFIGERGSLDSVKE